MEFEEFDVFRYPTALYDLNDICHYRKIPLSASMTNLAV